MTDGSLLHGKGKWVEETTLVAVLIRKRTGVKNRWVAERLGKGHDGSVTRAIRRVSENPVRKINLANLEAMLVSRDPVDRTQDPHFEGLPMVRYFPKIKA